MPRPISHSLRLTRAECKVWRTSTWQAHFVAPHRDRYLEGLKTIKPLMQTLEKAGADTRYVAFLIEEMVPAEYLAFPWDRVLEQLDQFEAALSGLKQLARDGDLPGERVSELAQAWFVFLRGESGKRDLIAELFLQHTHPPLPGRPGRWSFKALAYLLSMHLGERGIRARWKRTAELLRPFAPPRQLCDAEHVRQLVTKFKRTAGAETLERLTRGWRDAYDAFLEMPADA